MTMNGLKTGGSETSLHLENATPNQPSPSTIRGNIDLTWRNPRNWPLWKKNAQILMVAFHSMMGTFMAAGIIPAYDSLAEQYNITVPQASYLTSFQVYFCSPVIVCKIQQNLINFNCLLDLNAWPLPATLESDNGRLWTI